MARYAIKDLQVEIDITPDATETLVRPKGFETLDMSVTPVTQTGRPSSFSSFNRQMLNFSPNSAIKLYPRQLGVRPSIQRPHHRRSMFVENN